MIGACGGQLEAGFIALPNDESAAPTCSMGRKARFRHSCRPRWNKAHGGRARKGGCVTLRPVMVKTLGLNSVARWLVPPPPPRGGGGVRGTGHS